MIWAPVHHGGLHGLQGLLQTQGPVHEATGWHGNQGTEGMGGAVP